MEASVDKLPRCVVCRQVVHGSPEGVAFGLAGRFLFVACHQHVPLVRGGLHVARRVAVAGAKTLLQRKAPEVYAALKDAWEARLRQRELTG